MRERRADVVVVGAGIVGLAHAYHASRAGYDVVVLDRDEAAVGATVRNFGHIGTTAQAGRVLELAREAREDWIQVGADAGIPVLQSGSVVVARTPAELAVLEQFAASRPGEVVLLDPLDARSRIGFAPPGMVGAAALPLDLRIDPPSAIPALTRHLEARGVRFAWRTNLLDVGEETASTTRGRFHADRLVIAVGHDVDRLFPDLAEQSAVRRCWLRMLEADPPGGIRVHPALLTGTSMLRYDGLAAQPAAAIVREELAASVPRLLEADVNLMLTQRPDGRLVLGDTHAYGITETPFEDEADDDLLLTEFERLLGAPPVVRRRWRGVYASSAVDPFLVAEPMPGVTVVSVTTGIGMTTAFGLARSVLGEELVAD